MKLREIFENTGGEIVVQWAAPGDLVFFILRCDGKNDCKIEGTHYSLGCWDGEEIDFCPGTFKSVDEIRQVCEGVISMF